MNAPKTKIQERMKGSRMWPLMSVAGTAALFFVVTATQAIIEHFVQKPLEESGAASIAAVVQVPPSLTGPRLPFALTLTNGGGSVLDGLTVFASAPPGVAQAKVGAIGVRVRDNTVDASRQFARRSTQSVRRRASCGFDS